MAQQSKVPAALAEDQVPAPSPGRFGTSSGFLGHIYGTWTYMQGKKHSYQAHIYHIIHEMKGESHV